MAALEDGVKMLAAALAPTLVAQVAALPAIAIVVATIAAKEIARSGLEVTCRLWSDSMTGDGEEEPDSLSIDDLEYVRDLGLIKTEGKIRIANRLYQEVIPRELTYGTQVTISQETHWYIRQEDGLLDISKLLTAFQDFFRKYSESWVKRFQYKEAGPQLLMQAFLQRILNAGGHIHREYGLGRKRTDLLLIWQHQSGVQEVVIELKIRYGDLEKVIQEGLDQTWKYMDKCGTEDGHLVIFDRSPTKPWEEKIFCRQELFQEKMITVWGM